MQIVVAGDVVVDHHVYEGQRTNPAETDCRGVQVIRELGGAKALAELISEVIATTKTQLIEARKGAEAEYQEKKTQYDKGEIHDEPTREVIAPSPLEDCSARFGLELPTDLNAPPCGHHGLAIYRPYSKSTDEPDVMVWRASTLLGFGRDQPDVGEVEPKQDNEGCDVFRLSPRSIDHADILVLDDAAFMFRNAEECWMLDLAEAAKWIILKISSPVCRGELWHKLEPYRSKIIVIASVTELRPEPAAISEGLSWERTVEDLATALTSPEGDLKYKQLMTCRHVVITFSADGGLWLDNTNADSVKARLVYDAGSIEGQWAEQTEGTLFGFLSCMVVAVTKQTILAMAADQSDSTTTPDLVTAIATGLSTMRDLRTFGHGIVSDDSPTGYPVKRLAKVICNPPDRYSRCLVPWERLSAENLEPLGWSIAVQSQLSGKTADIHPMPMGGLAQQVVLRGRRALNHLPNATFGDLFTIDRAEIETLRTLRQLMRDYKRSGGDKPLSIGVFGPPGAGKSFGVKQIAREIFGKQAWLEFNLSQFNQSDLIGALHRVRDKVLEIRIPVVFWDEFDSKNYDWLQYLLAPMQDGRFQEGQVNHPIGSCVFIFAGATSHTFQQFGPPQGRASEWREFKLKKGPDFMSRLDGYYNVLGPNRRQLPNGSDDPDDTSAPIRRSLLLRQFLCGDATDQLKIEPGLLRALLSVPKYANGARSLQKLAKFLKPSKPAGPVRRSDLCSPTQLAMFMEFPIEPEPSHAAKRSEQIYRKFMESCESADAGLNKETIDALAAAIHENYQKHMKAKKFALTPPNDRPYNELPQENKEPNLEAAKRIPFVLAIAGLELKKDSECGKLPSGHDVQIKEHIEHHLKIMSELEHEGWCDERHKAGWRYGEVRIDERRIHNRLVPYEDLPEHEQEKDRDAVRQYVDHVKAVGCQIVFMGTEA